MSTVYVLEPPTKGKVVVNTSHGPLDIELWPKEAPKAVRNFVQLCMEGYYDNCIFHRIIKSFLIQGGDPTGSGQGGESIYGGPFPDEFHSRLRFKHRGLVACAGDGSSPNSNGSQFFITLDRCDWLDNKNTIFGKLTGDSVYNLLQLGEIDTDENDRPFDPPPKILSVEILWNPFDDIVPRVVADKSVPLKTGKGVVTEKATKKLNLLSFGEEAEEEEKELADVDIKIKSSHDVLNDPRLLKEETPKEDMELPEGKKNRDAQLNVREALSSKKEESRKKIEVGFPESLDYSDDDEASFDVRMRQQILRKRQEHGDLPDKQKSKDSASRKNRAASPLRSSVGAHEEKAKAKAEKLSLKKKGVGSKARAEHMANTDSDLQLLGEAEKERHLLKQKRRRRQGQEEEALAKLEQFKSFLDAKPKTSGGANAASKGEDLSDWKTVKLQFAPEPGKDNMTRSNDPNDYVVHDPLLEEGKQKFNKMLAKQKQRGREWAGKSLT